MAEGKGSRPRRTSCSADSRRLGGARPTLAVAVLVAGVAALSGCADHDEQSLCVAYSEYVVLADEAYSSDPTGATAAEAADAVEVLVGEIAQLRTVADGRYSAPIDELDALLRDLQNTLDSIPDEADYGTWRPLVDDSLADVRIAGDRLRDAIDPACAARFADETSSGPTTPEPPMSEEI